MNKKWQKKKKKNLGETPERNRKKLATTIAQDEQQEDAKVVGRVPQPQRELIDETGRRHRVIR